MRERDREGGRERDAATDTQRAREREREREAATDTKRESERERERENERERERVLLAGTACCNAVCPSYFGVEGSGFPLSRKIDIRLPEKRNSNSVHQIILMMTWIRTSRLSTPSFPL